MECTLVVSDCTNTTPIILYWYISSADCVYAVALELPKVRVTQIICCIKSANSSAIGDPKSYSPSSYYYLFASSSTLALKHVPIFCFDVTKCATHITFLPDNCL